MYRPEDNLRFGNVHKHDYANWGYIILYLVVILASFVGNSLFLMTIKKSPQLRRTHHFFLAFLSIRDLIVTFLVVPFVIDSQAVNLMQWNSGEIMCKLYTFLNYGTAAVHGYLLVFFLLFLYFWYRKQEAYMNEEGSTIVRKTRMHKWAIPLAWVIGLGLAIPAGALANMNLNQNTGIRSCAVWDGRGSGSNGYKVAVSNVFVAFMLPALVLIFPLLALLMQLCGAREPRLDPPHNRNALTAVLISLIFIISRAPYEVYELMRLFHQSSYGFKANPTWGTPYGYWTFETDIILNCIVFVAPALHPLIYFALNPDFRTSLVSAWKNLSCNQTPAQRAQNLEQKRQNKPRNYSNGAPIVRNRAPMNMRPQDEPLLMRNQPQIMAAAPGHPHYYPYPQMGVTSLNVPQPGTQYLFPEHSLVTSFDNSFERATPQLPPEFEFDGLRYIDTARVEPRKAYSPEKTPDKTPTTPQFSHTPFIPPGVGTVLVNPDPVWPQPGQNIEMKEMSPPVATSERKAEGFQLENLEGSPGNTLRERNRRITSPIQDIDDETHVEMLQQSPGAGRNRRGVSDVTEKKTNGRSFNAMESRSISPSSGHENVEIVIQGRTRSRQDLCPEVPKTKYEHAV